MSEELMNVLSTTENGKLMKVLHGITKAQRDKIRDYIDAIEKDNHYRNSTLNGEA